MKNKIQFDTPQKLITSASQPEFLPKSRIVILVSIITILTILLANRFIWKPILEVDQLSPRNIYASKDFKYKDDDSTQRLYNEVLSSIKPTLKKDPKISEQEYENLTELIQKVTDVKQATKEDPYYNRGLISTDVQDYVISLNQTEWEKIIYVPTIETLASLLAGGIPEKVDKNELTKAIDSILLHGGNEIARKAIIQIIVATFFPDKSIYFGSMAQDTSSEIAKKAKFSKLFTSFQSSRINNTRIFNKAVKHPSTLDIDNYVNRTAYLLRQLEVIRSIKNLNRLAYDILPPDIRLIAKQMNEDLLWKTKEIALDTFRKLLDDGITDIEVENIQDHLDKYLSDDISEDQRNLIYLLISKIAEPNVIIDQKQVEELKKEAIKTLQPVYIKVNKGKLLLRKGQKITTEKLKVLDAAGELDKQINWTGVSEIFSIVTIIVFIFVIYIYLFEKELFVSFNNLWLITILLFAITGISSLVVNGNQQFIPLAVFSGIIAMFVGQRASIICLAFALSLYYFGYDIDITSIITIISGSIAAIVILPKVNQRINILKCGIIIALIQVITYNIATIVVDVPQNVDILSSSGNVLWISTLWFVSGIIFSMIILAILPLIEEFFGLITYSRLIELGDFSQPLLRELEDKAPGTFQHSIAVATLTEYAARKLNLDPIYCRVGAYYHDVGKMLKPEYYIENQFDQENPHDKLDDPLKSAKIIVSHARAGLSLAKRFKLPQALMPFMTEHHGDSLVTYFYYKAKQKLKEGEQIDESQFRYFGPKPQSKETAITMIADSSEAAVRSLKEKSRKNIKNKIKDIVSEKMNDGQLSESGLKTDEIAIIVDAFTHVVLEMYHKRIEYPSNKKL
ncbi:MAG: HDIG domain-containing metalloprotein, partial [Cyanobacteriota bacterium]